MTDGRCPYCSRYQSSAGTCGTMNCPGNSFAGLPTSFQPTTYPASKPADPRDAELASLRAQLRLAEVELGRVHPDVTNPAEMEAAGRDENAELRAQVETLRRERDEWIAECADVMARTIGRHSVGVAHGEALAGVEEMSKRLVSRAEAAEARVAEMTKAVAPFAKIGVHESYSDDARMKVILAPTIKGTMAGDLQMWDFTVGDIRLAAAAIQAKEGA